jgi:hypothetical protein
VVWHQDGKFAIQITVRGKRALHAWRLAFKMPGDRITYLTGAAWQPTGKDGGTASAQDGEPGQWGNGDDGGADRSGHAISFTVFGLGTPVTPTGCSYNHATCTFS